MMTESVPEIGELAALNSVPIPGNPNPSTRWRWITKGISDHSGGRIKLQVWYVASRPFTTEAAVAEFLRECTEAQLCRSGRRGRAAADCTDAEMQEVGL